jgi:hypothetical protein
MLADAMERCGNSVPSAADFVANKMALLDVTSSLLLLLGMVDGGGPSDSADSLQRGLFGEALELHWKRSASVDVCCCAMVSSVCEIVSECAGHTPIDRRLLSNSVTLLQTLCSARAPSCPLGGMGGGRPSLVRVRTQSPFTLQRPKLL